MSRTGGIIPGTAIVRASPGQAVSTGPSAPAVLGGAVIGAVVAGPVGLLIGAGVAALASARSRSYDPRCHGLHDNPHHAPTQQLVQPLVQIRIPAERIRRYCDAVFYDIEVTSQGHDSFWTVARRYNDFYALNAQLTYIMNGFHSWSAPFPRKHLLSCTGLKLQRRRAQLERWLQRALQHPQNCNAMPKLLFDFLGIGRLQVALPPTVAQTAFPMTAPLVVPPPPSPATEVPESAPPQISSQMLQIQVPAGVVGGQVLAVAVPDGRQIAFTLPVGAAPGLQLQLEFDPTAGTLSAVATGPAGRPQQSAAPLIAESTGQVLLQVRVPPGAAPGQLLEVVVPSGQRLEVALPETAHAGADLQLWYDPTKGTLRSVT